MKIFVTTAPFGANNRLPLEMLSNPNIGYKLNLLGRKMSEHELMSALGDCEALIAGTETISEAVMDAAPRLKLISRVGVGLDGVDLHAARERGIKVSYTPEAPAPAVAELTLALMLSLLRSVHISNSGLHGGEWQRFFGRRLSECTIGVIGVGRIGARVLHRTKGFGTPRLLANDIAPNRSIDRQYKIEWVTKDQLLAESDVVTIHTPLTKQTFNMISEKELRSMKHDAVIINTARGGIINEQDLYKVLKEGHLSGAAIDVFEKEPYDGPLVDIERCILTAHMGSMSFDCRARMEIEATQEVLRFVGGDALENEVPESEYAIQAGR